MADTETEYPVAWVGRQPRRPQAAPELIDPLTGKPPRSQVGRERAEQAAREAEEARLAAEAAAGTPTIDADPPQHA